MTSTQITGGSVKYTVPSNYNSGRDGCEVTIHFSMAEGDGDRAPEMGDLARNEALRLATGTDRPYAATVASVRKAEAIEARAAGEVVVPPTPAPSVGASVLAPSPVQPAGVLAVSSAPAVATPAIVQSPVQTVQHGPTATIVASPSEAPPTVTASVISAETIVGASIVQPSEIDDAQLRKAVEDKLKELERAAHGDENLTRLGPVKVGQCLADFVPPPAKVYSLSQEQRPAFLAALAKVS